MYRSYLRSLVCVALASLFAALSADAQYTVNKLTNKSGGTVAAARVVVADTTTASAFTTTTSADHQKVIGVTTAAVNSNAVGSLAMIGVSEVYCAGAVALGDFLGTHTVAGYAASNASTLTGSFAIALEAGTDTTITCLLLGGTMAEATGSISPTSMTLPDGNATIIQGTDSDIRYGYDEAGEDRWEMNDGTNTFLWVKDMGTEGDAGITGNFYVQDDDFLILGDDSDIRFSYDEATDNRLEITDAAGNVLGYVTDDGAAGTVAATGHLLAPILGNLTTPALVELYDTYLSYNARILSKASATGNAGLTIPHGTAPTIPNNGDTWTTTSGFYTQVNGTTIGPFLDQTSALVAGDTFSSDVAATLEADGDTALTIQANSVALATDTTGNYLATATAGNGLSVSGSGSENAGITISFNYYTASGDQGLSANEVAFAASGIVAEGATANTIEGRILFADVSGSDKAWTFPNRTGTVILSGDTFSGDVTTTLENDGDTVTAIGTGVIVNNDVNASAAIAETKLALARIYWLSAGAIWPAASGGCSTPALDANNNVACAFAASTTGYMSVPVPSNYDGSTENVAVYWYKATDTNSVTWTIESVVIADNGDETATTATGTITNTAAPASATNVQIDSPSSTTFFGGSGNAGLWARIKITTNAYSGGTASLLGIKVEY